MPASVVACALATLVAVPPVAAAEVSQAPPQAQAGPGALREPLPPGAYPVPAPQGGYPQQPMAAPVGGAGGVPPTSAAAPLSLPEVYNDLYVLGPADVLQLTFLDPAAANLGGTVSILPDGTSTLALLGAVQLNGLTIGQATRWLTSLYSKILVRPQLVLTLTGPRPVKVTVIGEVERPGLYPMPSFSTPVSAIQTAGGITLNADIRKVMLRRLAGPYGNQKQTVLDLSQLFQLGNQLQNPILFDGDTLIIARTTDPLPDEVLQLGATNLAPTSISVTVLGEVKSPGTINLPANTPLIEAIFRAGGTTKWRANKNNVELVRYNRNGSTSRQVFAYKEDLNVSKGFNPPLRNRDTIIVNRSFYGETMDAINDVLVPLSTVGSLLNYSYFWNNFNR